MIANGRGGGDFFAAFDTATLRAGLLLLPRDADMPVLLGAAAATAAVVVAVLFAGVVVVGAARRVGLLPRGEFNDVDRGSAAVAAAIAERDN